MDPARVTQQSSSSVALRGELTHDAPSPRALRRDTFRGPLQWALEGPGWSVVRPTVDFILLCIAVVISLGGVHATLHVPSVSAPLLALPPLVLLLFFLRGLYRTRLRALVLDGVVPVLSTVSVGAMSVAVLGMYLNRQVPSQGEWLRAWLFALAGVGLGRVALSQAQRWARARRLVGKPVLIMGAGVVGAQVARRLESHPEYGLAPIGFLGGDAAAAVGCDISPAFDRLCGEEAQSCYGTANPKDSRRHALRIPANRPDVMRLR